MRHPSGSQSGASDGVPSITAVIVNYRTWEATARAVASVQAQDYPPQRLHIAVIDNASGDSSVPELRERFPEIEVLPSRRNLGFGGGNNLVIDRLESDLYFLLNSDAYLEGPMALRDMAAEFSCAASRVGAVAPKLLFTDRRLRLTLTAPPHFTALDGRSDSRVLGVALFSLHVNDDYVAERDVTYEAGFYAPEWVEGRRFRWTGPAASLQVRLPPGVDRGVLRLAMAPAPDQAASSCEIHIKKRTVRCNFVPRSASLGATRQAPTFDIAFGPEDLCDAVNNAGSFLVRGFHAMDRGFGRLDLGQFDESERVFAFCGAAVLLSTEALRDVGTFDNDFFLYYEDTDLSWRMQQRRWEIFYQPRAVVRHDLSLSTVDTSDLFTFYVLRNRLLMLTKNAHWWAATRAFGGLILTISRQWSTLGTARGRHAVLLRLKVAASYLRQLPATVRKRRSIRA